MVELDGQVAIVTGAGRGIGRAIALELASLGADVVVAEINEAAALQTASEIEQTGRRAVGVRVDVTSAADRQTMVAQTLNAFGRIDILVNNAGVYRAAPPLEITDEHWETVIAVNSKAVLFCSLAVLPTMIAARRGAIVNLASMAGKIASGTGLVYAVSKAAVISLTRSLAVAYAGDGVRVNCVCPGFVDTDMWVEVDRQVGVAQMGKQPGEYGAQRAATVPLGRMAQAEDIAHVVGFLTTSKASYMTGQAVNVTGGLITY
jgi:NAD(P)-dependent dehydrogenase (short-subunit alcohol dehydrogenase family)